ncbi:helix-turn-helix transcriptional regulator [Bacillus sp. M6-12]|uniref:helix-turn-helix transcriptional regulator n=1 Tax=Bacillus sp. M6-12 TaxID=2054166 RepID=UPI0015E140B1|nr:helix-turn-helix transcriptional regulator [Bacillus sp. M6-12]
MLNKKTIQLVEAEVKQVEDKEVKKAYNKAVEAVTKAKESGMYPEVETARELLHFLPAGDAKKALMEELRSIPRREKIKSLAELKQKGLCIIDEDETTVENHIMTILKEKGLLVSDLAKLTGISRQNINAVVKNKMKPGVDFALKVSHVLGISVEELFTLTESAWVKPYKQERDSTLYVDVVNLMILDNTAKKEEIAVNGFEYFNQDTKQYMTRDEHAELLKELLNNHTPAKVEELKEEGSDLSTVKLTSQAKEELRNEFNEKYIKVYKKLGERIQPYVINSKKVVSKS